MSTSRVTAVLQRLCLGSVECSRLFGEEKVPFMSAYCAVRLLSREDLNIPATPMPFSAGGSASSDTQLATGQKKTCSKHGSG